MRAANEDEKTPELNAAIAEGERAYAESMGKSGQPVVETGPASQSARQATLHDMLRQRQKSLSELTEMPGFK